MAFTEEEIKLIQSALDYYAVGSQEFQSYDESMALWVIINKIVDKLTEKSNGRSK